MSNETHAMHAEMARGLGNGAKRAGRLRNYARGQRRGQCGGMLHLH